MNENQEINIKELLYAIVKKWRLLLILVVISCVLFATLAVINNARISISDDEVSARQKALSTNADIKTLTARIDSNQKLLDTRQNVLNQSILLKIDPNAQSLSEAKIAVTLIGSGQISTQQQLVLSAITANYLQAKSSDDFTKFINQYLASGYTKDALNEIVSITSPDIGSLNIKVVFRDAAGASKMSFAVIEYLNSYARTNLQMVQPHKLELISKEESIGSNPAIASQKKFQEDAIAKLKTSIESDQAEIKSIVIKDLDSKKRKSVPQYAILGILLGLFVGSAYVFLRYITNNRLTDADIVKNRLGLYLIGTVRSDR